MSNLNRDKYINSIILETQERILKSIVSLDENAIFFDIGACEGESSIRYSTLFPNAIIYTFEPLPSNFELVKNNITNYKKDKINPVQLCLSDTIGETTFHVSSGNPDNADESNWNYGNKSSSLLAPAKTKEVHSWLKFEEAITVQTSTLKQFCIDKNIAVIDFIHMDVQGAELMVLKGAEDFIKHINMIWLEVEAVELYKGQPLKHDVENFMLQIGFLKLEDTVYTTAGDQFWARKEYILSKKGSFFVFQHQLYSTVKLYYKKLRRKLLN
jgi:FkbM family methyltransferase